MGQRDAVIISAVRTAIGNFNGALAGVSAVELGAIVIKGALAKAGLEPLDIDEVIMGNVLQAGLGQNPARQAAVRAGLPFDIPSMTINKVCGSGLKAVHLAVQSIQCGDHDVVLAGGMENMSQAPYLIEGAREGLRLGDQKLVDSMIHDGLWCAFNDYHMGITAENICDQYGLNREELDEFSVQSQRKAAAAIAEGKFKEEIIPVEMKQRKGDPIVFDRDEFVKAGTTLEQLTRLRPAFKPDGMVTAGNASGINDGAACLILMSREKSEKLGLKPLAVVKANASAGVDPKVMGIGPVPAVTKAMQKAGICLDDVDVIEANEAFAAQSVAVGKELGFKPEIVNVNGGAIALGHPIGASGARILVTLLHELGRRDDARYGLAALCIGGGQGIATIVEKEKVI